MTCRILALDGGGAWAVLQVMALAAIYGEDAKGQDVLRDFNLVAANSGGSIALGGLVENFTLAELRDDFFRNQDTRGSVFVHKGVLASIPSKVLSIGPRYDTARKLVGLQALLKRFGATPMSQLARGAGGLPDLVICTFDYDRLRGVLFRSSRDSRAASFTRELDPTLAEAIHASTDAPVNYFDAPARLPATASTRQFWDGGIAGYNNPVMMAVAEALANGHAACDIRALSLGTGTTFLPADPDRTQGDLGQPPRQLPRDEALEDLIADVRTLAIAIVDDPPDIASYLAHLALGGRTPAGTRLGPHAGIQDGPVSGPVVRLNPMIQPVRVAGEWAVPAGISDFAALRRIDLDATSVADIDAIVEFGNAWIANRVPNQPIRCNRDDLSCEIGQPTFDRACAVWNSFPRP